MEKLSLDVERKLNILSKHSLNIEEWFFIELIFLALEGDEKPLYKYFTECSKTTLPKDTLQHLKDKKVFSAAYKVPKEGENFDYQQVKFSKTFLNNYLKESHELGEELFEAYPAYMQFGDKLFPAKNITKTGFNSLEAFFYAYGKAIKFNPETHRRVMDSLEFAKENELITYGIAEYVISRKWLDHWKVQETGELSRFVIKVNTMETI